MLTFVLILRMDAMRYDTTAFTLSQEENIVSILILDIRHLVPETPTLWQYFPYCIKSSRGEWPIFSLVYIYINHDEEVR